MAYRDKIQKIAEDKKTKDRIEYFSKNKPGFSGSKKDKEEMINKFSKRKNLSKKDAESYLKSQSIQDDIAKFDSSFKATDDISEKNLSGREGSFAKGGLVRSGKPKIAKKGWR
jgi:hypothetical protein